MNLFSVPVKSCLNLRENNNEGSLVMMVLFLPLQAGGARARAQKSFKRNGKIRRYYQLFRLSISPSPLWFKF